MKLTVARVIGEVPVVYAGGSLTTRSLGNKKTLHPNWMERPSEAMLTHDQFLLCRFSAF